MPVLSDRQHTALCLALAAASARRFAGTEPAPTDEILADEVGIPLLQARELLNIMIATGILVRTAGAQPTYLPAHDPGTLWVSDLIQTIANAGSSTDGNVPDQLTGLFTALDQAATEHLAGVSLAALATGCRYEHPVPAIDKPAASPV
jgi:DNA-binding IscR family transcriptional regulator